jgi:hypothetical protein
MTDLPILPDWVLIEAAKRFEWDNVATSELRRHYHDENYIGYRALCDMIAKHEQPPVDRKLLCAREAVREMRRRDGDNVCLGVRAIELWEEGFGK